MARGESRFRRPLGRRRYRTIFVISTEGSVTEPAYFEGRGIFDALACNALVKCVPRASGKSSPVHVLEGMKQYLKKTELRDNDEAWLVVDKDNWTDKQLKELHDWAKVKENYGLAVSNPCFEYWLLLHFEGGSGMSSSRECTERLKNYDSDYKKRVEPRKYRDKIDEAVRRAKGRDDPPCADWPRNTGTTVYRLVEKILASGG